MSDEMKNHALNKLFDYAGVRHAIDTVEWADGQLIMTDTHNKTHVFDYPVTLRQIMTIDQSLSQIAVQGAEFDPDKRRWRAAGGENVALTELEAKALSYLADQSPDPIPGEKLLKRVWEYHQGAETHTVETHIYRIRKKIEPNPSNPCYLKTADDGQGYYLALSN